MSGYRGDRHRSRPHRPECGEPPGLHRPDRPRHAGRDRLDPVVGSHPLSRNCTDWYPLLDLCGYYDCLIADRDGVYNAGTANGRLLLGLKGTISEIEDTLRGRLTAGLLNKAERGELALTLPAGLERDPTGGQDQGSEPGGAEPHRAVLRPSRTSAFRRADLRASLITRCCRPAATATARSGIRRRCRRSSPS